MKVSYEESLASYFGLQRRGGSGDRSVLSVRAKGNAGQPLSSDIKIPVCRPCTDKGKATSSSPPRQGEDGHGGVVEPVHVSKFQAREPGDPVNIRRGREATPQPLTGRLVNVSGGNAKMNVDRKSDGSVVPAKSANKGGSKAPAEWMEERDPVERNIGQAAISRTQCRIRYDKAASRVCVKRFFGADLRPTQGRSRMR